MCFSHPRWLCRTYNVKLSLSHLWKVVHQWNNMHTPCTPSRAPHLQQSRHKKGFFPHLLYSHTHITQCNFTSGKCEKWWASYNNPTLRTHRPSDLTKKKSPLTLTHRTRMQPFSPCEKPHSVLLHLVMLLKKSCTTLTTPCRDREGERQSKKTRRKLGWDKQTEQKRWEMAVCLVLIYRRKSNV